MKKYYLTMVSERLWIKPASFGEEQRVEASKLATERGDGLVMEVWSSTTEFWSDPAVPVGAVDVYEAKRYGGQPEYVGRLHRAEDHYEPFMDWSK